MEYKIEIMRTNVTPAQFFAYIKNRCEEKGLVCIDDIEEFKNPSRPANNRYYVKDGVKHSTYDGFKMEFATDDVPAEAEINKSLPFDYWCYFKLWDGTEYNEICEFTFDNEKRGHGYYYQWNRYK